MGKKLACALMFWAAPFAQAQSQEPADAAPESVPPPTEAHEPAPETAEGPPEATPASPDVDAPAPAGPDPTRPRGLLLREGRRRGSRAAGA